MQKLISRGSAFSYLVLLCGVLNGCSLFFGNIKPVEEKSTSYGILDLSKVNSEWTRVDTAQPTSEVPQSGIPDLAFQSNKTASIISINSACKRYETDRSEGLSSLTRELLLGIPELKIINEQDMTVAGQRMRETTVEGKLNNEPMKLRTVVIQRANCVYDLMYISRPEKFSIHEADFARFVSSLKLK